MPNETQSQMIQFQPCCLPVSNRLCNAIDKHIQQAHPSPLSSNSLTINFRDSNYGAESGGYHPVEIRVQRDEAQQWHFCYITDFAYCGGPYPELEVEIDFNIEQNSFRQMFLAPSPLNKHEVTEFYKVWESNFLEYLSDGAFDQIEVSA
ncbi:DUF2787 domain-containing protein [Vibrio agarivorans]|uniref:DUF2787 domain-containing protein n=1 Tax=Vibrio agarivorans TaxID=153622 RepID=UPI0025B628CB|nr:DUF2787 domain-containing protein [Vibrio agarivorans]MDN3660454.1 DUF2787 domain-containing protein [Vibrio agarivorans]